jgi:hypothetical protein
MRFPIEVCKCFYLTAMTSLTKETHKSGTSLASHRIYLRLHDDDDDDNDDYDDAGGNVFFLRKA